jgi:hypothetical protein
LNCRRAVWIGFDSWPDHWKGRDDLGRGCGFRHVARPLEMGTSRGSGEVSGEVARSRAGRIDGFRGKAGVAGMAG